MIYLTISRPDLANPIHVLSQHMICPRAIYWHATLKLVRYLSSTINQGLFYKAKTDPVLVGFCDANCGSCPQTRQSLTGYCMTLDSTVVSWKCNKQKTVSHSSA